MLVLARAHEYFPPSAFADLVLELIVALARSLETILAAIRAADGEGAALL